MIKIHDLYAVFEIELAHILQPVGSIDEYHDLVDAGHAAADRLLAQARTELIAGLKTRDIRRGLPVANRMAFFIDLVLSKHAAQIHLAGLGLAIGLLATPSLQLLRHHRHARAIRTHIHNGRIAPARLGAPLLPSLSAAAHALDYPLNLPPRHGNAAGLFQMPLGLEIGWLIGPFQTNEPCQGWRVADFQSQRGIGRMMALVFARVIIVI